MLCRVIYKPDETIAVIHPAPKARLKDESDQDFLNRIALKTVKGTELENCPYDDIEKATLPDRRYRDKWRGSKVTGIKIDHSIVTEAEKRQTIEDDIDNELAKSNPDLAKVMKLQRKLDKKDY
jgi:hypothetical protein